MTLAPHRLIVNSHCGQFIPATMIAYSHGKTHCAGRSLTTTTFQSTDLKKKDLAWQSVKGGGRLDETTQYNRLNVDQLNALAGNRISVDLGVRDSVALLAQQPGMGWLKQVQDDPLLADKIDWKSIEETHKKWDYKQQGLTPAAAVVVTIVVAFFTAGAGTAALGTTATTAAGTTTTLAGTTLATTTAATATAAGVTTYTTAGIIINTAVTSLASKAAVSLINNGGNLGATLKELGSKDNLRQLATSLVTAGVLSELGQIEYAPGKTLNKVNVGDGFSANVGKNLINGLARATVNSALSGTDLETSIRTETIASILNAASAQGANFVGDQATEGGFLINDAGKVNEFGRAFAHAVVGCAAGAAGASAGGSNIGTGSGCGAGALGAVVGELAAQLYGGANPAKTVAFASALSGIAAALAGQGAEGVSIAASTGANAAANNRLLHPDRKKLVANKVAAKTGEKVDSDKIKSRILFDLGEAGSLEKGGTYNQFTFIPELQKAGLCDNINACFQIAGTLNGDLGSNKAVFLASPQDSPAVRYQAAVEFLGGNFETWLNTPGNEKNKTDFASRITNTPTGLVNLSDFYSVALVISTQQVAQEAGFATGANTLLDKVGQGLQNIGNFKAKGAAAAILDNCLACPQSLQDKPNLAFLLGDIVLSATVVKDVALLGARGVAAVAGKDIIKGEQATGLKNPNIDLVGDTTGFNPLGIVTDPKASQQGRLLIQQFRQQGLSIKAAELEARAVLQTGDALPSISIAKAGDKFYKLVPEGLARGPSPSTPFFVDQAQFNELLLGNPINIGSAFGLPNKTSASAYEVYEISVQSGQAPLVFRSNIAPVVDDGILKSGGKVQSLLPKRSAFSDPVQVLNSNGNPLIIRSK